VVTVEEFTVSSGSSTMRIDGSNIFFEALSDPTRPIWIIGFVGFQIHTFHKLITNKQAINWSHLLGQGVSRMISGGFSRGYPWEEMVSVAHWTI